MNSRGGIIIFILILTVLAAGTFFTIRQSQAAMPDDFLYSLKRKIEIIQIAGTSADNLGTAQIYLKLANIRLDELDYLDKKNVNSAQKQLLIDEFWMDEQKAIKSLDYAYKFKNVTVEVNNFKKLNLRGEELLQKLVDKTPPAQFYQVLDILNKLKDKENYRFGQ